MTNPCSSAVLESALAGNLPPNDEDALHRHLGECEACSAALERMAGGTALCKEAASLLVEDELDAALPPRDEWSAVDFTVEHLEPADEPNVLGRLGGYDVLDIIGHGGMGVVLKAFDRELKRCVAIKVLAPHLAQSSLAKKRFAREAQAAAAIVHPHVLAIHHVQPNGPLPFLVMPLVAGESLAERLVARGTLELTEMLRIGMQAAAGLAAAHEQGLVHRDVKPANILLEKGIERAVLTDFGLARAADDVTLTRWGIIAGTPQYMSPEQARGEPLDGRSDLFSLGCVLYEMATGVSPFRTDSVLATMRRLVDEAPRAMAALNPELPPWFIAIVDRLLEKDPSRRFGSAKEVSELLEQCLAHVQQPAVVPLPAGVSVSKSTAHPAPAAQRSRTNRFIGGIVVLLFIGFGGFGAFLMATAEPCDISGEWTGDDWGKVVLKQTAPAEYAGTYTDAFGKEPGKTELKWSRIERRYNGTWSEGKDRLGKMSVRPVGDEIRGAWTTNRKSDINPGTPALADLLWVRPNTRVSTNAPSPNLTFGPVHEFALNDSGQAAGIDLDTDRVLPEFAGDIAQFNAESWRKTNGIDISQVRLVTGKEGAGGHDLTFREINNKRWLTITPEEIANELTKAQSAQNVLLEAGSTYVVKTREAGKGVLQIVGFTKQPHGVTIRYKMVQGSTAKVADAKSAAVPLQAAAAFGPALDRVLPFGEPCAMKYFQFHTGNVIAIGDGPGDKSDHSEEFRRAEESGGLDASALGLGNGVQFAGHGCVFLAAGDRKDWDTLTAERTIQTLQHDSWLKGVVEVYEKDFPATYLLKTAQGAYGILQIIGLTDENPHPGGVKIRYKLVERPEQTGKRAETNPELIDDSLWDVASSKFGVAALSNLPPTLILRPTHFTNQLGAWDEDDRARAIGRGVDVAVLLCVAYDADEWRRIDRGDLPKGNYDLLLTLPDHPQAALQEEIRKQFGLVGRRQVKERDVFALRMKHPNAPGLNVTKGGESRLSSLLGKIFMTNQPISSLAKFLEIDLVRPVVDQTGSTRRYDGLLEWKVRDDHRPPSEEIQKALLDQFGLELVASRAPVEMVIVEKEGANSAK
jgi:serine/threonine-protein kinase